VRLIAIPHERIPVPPRVDHEHRIVVEERGRRSHHDGVRGGIEEALGDRDGILMGLLQALPSGRGGIGMPEQEARAGGRDGGQGNRHTAELFVQAGDELRQPLSGSAAERALGEGQVG
jgi:hypothetical protein